MMKLWMWKLQRLFSILVMIIETLLKVILKCKAQDFLNQ